MNFVGDMNRETRGGWKFEAGVEFTALPANCDSACILRGLALAKVERRIRIVSITGPVHLWGI